MLGGIARKLRFFGFDTLYMVHAHDDDVLNEGICSDRIILTADRELFKRMVKKNAKGVLVDGGTELEDLVHVLSKQGIERVNLDTGNSRCPDCGATLSQRNRAEVSDIIPQAIVSRYNKFFRCSKCGKVYWEGGHYVRMRLLAERINAQLNAEMKPSLS